MLSCFFSHSTRFDFEVSDDLAPFQELTRIIRDITLNHNLCSFLTKQGRPVDELTIPREKLYLQYKQLCAHIELKVFSSFRFLLLASAVAQTADAETSQTEVVERCLDLAIHLKLCS